MNIRIIFVAALIMASILSSCNNDNTSGPSSNEVKIFRANLTNDTAKVEFEVRNTTTSQPLTYELFFSSTSFKTRFKLTEYTSGSMNIQVYQDTLRIVNSTYNTVVDTTINYFGRPTKLIITPSNFSGKGNLEINKN